MSALVGLTRVVTQDYSSGTLSIFHILSLQRFENQRALNVASFAPNVTRRTSAHAAKRFMPHKYTHFSKNWASNPVKVKTNICGVEEIDK